MCLVSKRDRNAKPRSFKLSTLFPGMPVVFLDGEARGGPKVLRGRWQSHGCIEQSILQEIPWHRWSPCLQALCGRRVPFKQ